ncbi:glyoxalase [Marmoricola sp. Leaf446]|uniref:VOC family protein n=1 Tax=Marmoricola sp. Leaf446 TaxID=1736379 RepID=UPI0006F7E374|nr:VOC family protein [Marmoricola sp. Leaf446]KQT91613.1 glyoxalase [Marmoricola sp. Leaf446]
MSDPASTPPPTVWPAFNARDPRAMIDFLVAIGFEATAVYGDEHEVAHAQLDWPEGGGVMFGSVKDHGLSRPPGAAGFYVVTADPRAVHGRAVAAGARITRAPENPDYAGPDGWEFSLEDPEGNAWSFGTYPGEPRAGG